MDLKCFVDHILCPPPFFSNAWAHVSVHYLKACHCNHLAAVGIRRRGACILCTHTHNELDSNTARGYKLGRYMIINIYDADKSLCFYLQYVGNWERSERGKSFAKIVLTCKAKHTVPTTQGVKV